MAVTVVRPTANSVIGSGWTLTGGAGSHWAAQADALDTTYSAAPKDSGLTRLVLGDVTVDADERILAARIRLRVKGQGASTDIRAKFFDTYNTAEDRWTFALSSSFNEVVGAWRTVAPDTTEWTAANFASALLFERNKSTSATDLQIAAAYVDVDIRTQLTADVTAPTGTVVTTTQPTVAVGYTDPDAGAATVMRVAVYSAAVYGAGGFDPAVDTALAAWYYEGVYEPTIVVGAPLVDGVTYRAYGWVAKDHNGAPWYSAADFTTFDINVTPPTTPTVTTAYDAPTHDTTVTITGAAPPPGSTAYAYALAYDDGDGFVAIPGGVVTVPLAGPYIVDVVHRTAARGLEGTYRAVATATVGGFLVSSGAGTASRTIALDKRWIMRSLTADGTGLDLIDAPVLDAPQTSLAESAGVFRPLGRRNAVVVSSGVHGEDGGLTMLIRSGWPAARALLRSTDPVFITDPFGGNSFVHWTSRDWALLGTAAAPRRPVSVRYVEVDEPTADGG